MSEPTTTTTARTIRPPRPRGRPSGDELAQAIRQRDEYLDQLQRARPSSPTTRSGPRPRPTPTASTCQPLALDLLDVLDNFDRAIEAARAGGASAIVEGLDMVHKQLLAALAKHGVEPIAALGQPFDPNHHEAMMQQPDADSPRGRSSPSWPRATSSATASSARPRSPSRSARPSLILGSRKPSVPRGEPMPTYDYICDACEHEFEAFESIKADPQTVCPTCHEAKLRRKIGAGAAILFKGSGFYQTDYRSDSYKKGAAADKPAVRSRLEAGRVVRPAKPDAAPKPPEALDGRRPHDPGPVPDLRQGLRGRRRSTTCRASPSAPTAASSSTSAAGSTAPTPSPAPSARSRRPAGRRVGRAEDDGRTDRRDDGRVHAGAISPIRLRPRRAGRPAG